MIVDLDEIEAKIDAALGVGRMATRARTDIAALVAELRAARVVIAALEAFNAACQLPIDYGTATASHALTESLLAYRRLEESPQL